MLKLNDFHYAHKTILRLSCLFDVKSYTFKFAFYIETHPSCLSYIASIVVAHAMMTQGARESYKDSRLINWGQGKMAVIFGYGIFKTFSWMKTFEY